MSFLLVLFLLIITTILISNVLYYVLSSSALARFEARMNFFFQIFELFAWLIISRIAFLFCYVVAFHKMLSFISTMNVFPQIVCILFPIIIVLLIVCFTDYRFLKHLFTNSPQSLKALNFVSIFTKLTITVLIMFVLGVKDTAYSLLQANGLTLDMLFVYDMCIMFFASSIAGFDYVIDFVTRPATQNGNESK